MATVTELKNGIWVIHWFTDATNGSTNVQCGQTSFQLNSTFGNDQVTLTLNEIQATVASSIGAATPGPALPLKVYATYNNQMKEMNETSRGQWAAISWPYLSVNNVYDPDNYYTNNYGYRYVNYQLTLEFRDTSFAKGERQALSHLSKLLDNQSMSDVTFVVQNEKIFAHSAIVVSGSPVIRAMLEVDKFKEGRTKLVEVEDIEPAVFKEMLRYLYTGKAPKLDDDDMTEPLFLAADKYQIEALKDLCEQSLMTRLKLETVLPNLVVAHLYTAPQLLEASLKFLVSRKTEVWLRPEWKELMKKFPDLFFLASQGMIG